MSTGAAVGGPSAPSGPSSLNVTPSAAVGGPTALVYNSNTVDVRPVVLTQVDTNPSGPVPTQIQARLTWNGGSPGGWVTFSTSGHSAGDSYLLGLQLGSAVSTSGRYSYTVDVSVQ